MICHAKPTIAIINHTIHLLATGNLRHYVKFYNKNKIIICKKFSALTKNNISLKVSGHGYSKAFRKVLKFLNF